jgi:hypothetical protein
VSDTNAHRPPESTPHTGCDVLVLRYVAAQYLPAAVRGPARRRPDHLDA